MYIDPAVCCSPSSLSIAIPPSKSHTLRALLFALMAEGASQIEGYLHSPDTRAMLEAITLLGGKIDVQPNQIIVRAPLQLQPPNDVINAGNSGQVLRFVSAIASLIPGFTVLTGDHSIRSNRPMQPLLDALNQLGATALSTRSSGYAPIVIQGMIEPGHAELDGADSQPVSSLLIATSFLPGPSTLHVINPGEKPWVALTLTWLKKLGIEVQHDQFSHFHIPGRAKYSGFFCQIPGDFSSAAFPLAAALITGKEITLCNLDMQDAQGDKRVLEILISMGAKIEIDEKKQEVHVLKSPPLVGRTIDVDDIIDAIPILSVIGCFAEGTTSLIHAASARNKESDRLHAMTVELAKMGARIEESLDSLHIHHSPLQGALLSSHQDHRVAMALAVAALGAKGPSRIVDVACIEKSYPTFLTSMQSLGFPLTT